MSVTATLSFDADRDPRLPASLLGWLDRDRTLRRNATITAVTRRGDHEWQNAIDIINLVLSNTIAAGSLAISIRSWLQSRPKPPTITITLRGMTITVDGASPESLALLERALESALDHDDDA